MRAKAHITTFALAWAIRASAAQGQAVDAVAHLRRGVELRQQGHDDEARAEFQQAYDATHTPVAAGQLGFAEQALGQWVAAEAHVREAMAATADDWVRRNRAALESADTTIQQHVGQLEVTGGLVGAEVLVNGERVGTLPFAEPARLLAGTVTFEVRQPGYYPLTRRTEILAGALTREVVDLRPLPREPSSETGARTRGSRSDAAPQSSRLDPRWRVIGWSAAGIGAVALVGGVIANVLRENRAAFYNMSCPGDATDPNFMNCADAHGNVDLDTGLAIAGYATGGALVLVGIGLAVWAAPQPQRPAAMGSAACGAGPGTIGVSCAARF